MKKEIKMKTKFSVSCGQYETAATTVTINHTTWRGLCRRLSQLENEYAVHGDNFAGWIKADIALADDRDKWGDNSIIGGRWCEPYHGWLVTDDDEFIGEYMTYNELKKRLYGDIEDYPERLQAACDEDEMESDEKKEQWRDAGVCEACINRRIELSKSFEDAYNNFDKAHDPNLCTCFVK